VGRIVAWGARVGVGRSPWEAFVGAQRAAPRNCGRVKSSKAPPWAGDCSAPEGPTPRALPWARCKALVGAQRAAPRNCGGTLSSENLSFLAELKRKKGARFLSKRAPFAIGGRPPKAGNARNPSSLNDSSASPAPFGAAEKLQTQVRGLPGASVRCRARMPDCATCNGGWRAPTRVCAPCNGGLEGSD